MSGWIGVPPFSFHSWWHSRRRSLWKNMIPSSPILTHRFSCKHFHRFWLGCDYRAQKTQTNVQDGSFCHIESKWQPRPFALSPGSLKKVDLLFWEGGYSKGKQINTLHPSIGNALPASCPLFPRRASHSPEASGKSSLPLLRRSAHFH